MSGYYIIYIIRLIYFNFILKLICISSIFLILIVIFEKIISKNENYIQNNNNDKLG